MTCDSMPASLIVEVHILLGLGILVFVFVITMLILDGLREFRRR